MLLRAEKEKVKESQTGLKFQLPVFCFLGLGLLVLGVRGPTVLEVG